MLDKIERVVEKAITKLDEHMDHQLKEATYTTKDKVKNWAIGIASAGVIYYFAHEGHAIAATAFASLAMIGNFAKGELTRSAKMNMLRKSNRATAPKVEGLRSTITERENLEEVFVVQFYTANGKTIAKTSEPIDTYMNAVIEGSEGLGYIERAASFNIEKYYKKRGDQ